MVQARSTNFYTNSQRMPLTDVKVRRTKSQDKAYKLTDGEVSVS